MHVYNIRLARAMFGLDLLTGLDMSCAAVRIDYEPTANWFNWSYRCLPAAQKAPQDRLSSLEILKWGAQHDPDASYIKRALGVFESDHYSRVATCAL